MHFSTDLKADQSYRTKKLVNAKITYSHETDRVDKAAQANLNNCLILLLFPRHLLLVTDEDRTLD